MQKISRNLSRVLPKFIFQRQKVYVDECSIRPPFPFSLRNNWRPENLWGRFLIPKHFTLYSTTSLIDGEGNASNAEAPAGKEDSHVSLDTNRPWAMRAADAAFEEILAGKRAETGDLEPTNDTTPFPPAELQKSLRVGIVGAPNAGKSVFTNALVGSKVSIVSRKTNTTRREILGVVTRGDTQLLLYDTPGATLRLPSQPMRAQNESMVARAWQVMAQCEVLLLLVDAERQIRKPDWRVKYLVEKVGGERVQGQARVACLNKVDLVKDKKELLPLADWLQGLHGLDRVFMTSGLKGGGMNALEAFLLSKASLRPWEEDPTKHCTLSDQEMAGEIVREAVLDRLHEEIPYTLEQRLLSWKYLHDGSLRVEKTLLVESESQRAIVVGKQGKTIR